MYEPFLFAKDSGLYTETHEIIKTRLKSSPDMLDMIAGNFSHIYEFKNSILTKV